MKKTKKRDTKATRKPKRTKGKHPAPRKTASSKPANRKKTAAKASRGIKLLPTPPRGAPNWHRKGEEKPCVHCAPSQEFKGHSASNRQTIESRPVHGHTWETRDKEIGRRRRIRCKVCNARWTELEYFNQAKAA